MLDPIQQSSIPLIYLNNQPDPKFILNPKAIELIQSFTSNNNMSFISICGDYRSGKSFLMNSLFFSKQGFKVSPTTQPCTKGINIWSKPISSNGKNIWILDTQGFGAIDRDDSYDVKIFLLTTLLSDIIMYNSFGALDQNAINKFAAICLKAKSLDSTIGRLKMFWILRDFSLSMQNKQGKMLSSDEYLSQSLDDNLSMNKQQRKAIKKVFTQRFCVPLVRPVIDQTALSQLNETKFEQLRGQFVEQIYKLRKNMLSVVENKIIQGVTLNGQNLPIFLNKYLDVLNKNQVDTQISSTWQKIVSYEKQKQTLRIKSVIRQFINKQSQKLPYTIDEVQKLIKDIQRLIQQQMRQFKKHFNQQLIINETLGQVNMYKNDLIQMIKNKNELIILNEQRGGLKVIFDNLSMGLGKQYVIDGQSTLKYLSRIFKTRQQYWNKFNKYIIELTNNEGLNNNSLNSSNNIKKECQQITKLSQSISCSSRLMYYEYFYNEQKIILPKIIGKFSQQIASTIIKLNQSKKIIKKQQSQMKIIRQQLQQKKQQQKQLIQRLSVYQKQIIQYKKQIQIRSHKLQAQITKRQNDNIQVKQQYQSNIEQLKQTILNLQKNFISIKKQHQLDIIEYQDKIKYINEKNQLLTNKIQLLKSNNQKYIQQIKQQYQNKLNKQCEKYNQLHNLLNSQRKKFIQLNKCKKQQQSQLLQDLAQKNQKLLNLRRQVVNIQYIYKQQLQLIIKQQKQSIISQYQLQLQEKQHQLIIYQQKLQQYIIKIKQLQFIQQKYINLLIQNKLIHQQFDILKIKYNQYTNQLKTYHNQQQQHLSLIDQIKNKYQLQIKNKIQTQQKLILSIKSIQQQKNQSLKQLQFKYNQQLNKLIKQNKQQKQQYQNKINNKFTIIQQNNKQQINHLINQNQLLYNQIQQIKISKYQITKLNQYIHQLYIKLIQSYKSNQQEINSIFNKYTLLYKQSIKSNINNSSNTHNNQLIKNINNQTQIIEQNSQLQQSSFITENNNITNQHIYINCNNQKQSSKQSIQQQTRQIQSTYLSLLSQLKSQTQHLQDLKYSFKQTISQLQSCQSHINHLNTTIKSQQLTIKNLDQSLIQFNHVKHQLNLNNHKLQSISKQNHLLKKQVQIRDEIYNKRQSSIKQNLQLYKQTITNLTEENQHLSQKNNKLQIQINRFTDWEADLLYNNNRSKSNLGSIQYLGQNQQVDEYSFSNRIQKLQKQNRKLRKQLHSQKQLSLTNIKQPNNILSTILLDTNQSQILQSTRKQNLLYKKRVQQLRDRELKLIQQMKILRNNQKQSSQTKINLVKQQFQQYKKKTKQQIHILQNQINLISQQKYKIKQQLLLFKQNINNINNNRNYNNQYNNNELRQNNNNTRQNNNQKVYSLSAFNNKQTQQDYVKTICQLRQQNSKLQLQLQQISNKLIKVKDQSDKKLAQLQIIYEQKIKKLQIQRSRIQLQNQKNKTKYQHLLKVNNDLIIEVDNFKSKANNQLTLKQKYKNKISSLFINQ